MLYLFLVVFFITLNKLLTAEKIIVRGLFGALSAEELGDVNRRSRQAALTKFLKFRPDVCRLS